MRPASLPADEEQRVQALLHTGLLDSEQEERFDRLTSLAQQVLRVPIALVSLVDSHRQWFKSRQGLQLRETPRVFSFCADAILGDEILEVEDARADVRFAGNPLVTGSPYVCFYAGAPLSTKDGHRIGTLCVISDQPRRLSSAERRILRALADCVEAEIHNMDLLRQSHVLEVTKKLGDFISQSQSLLMQDEVPHPAFDSLLQGLLQLTESKRGMVAEVRHHEDGATYFPICALTRTAQECMHQTPDVPVPCGGVDFTKLQTLSDAALQQRKPVIVNEPSQALQSGLLPEALPDITALMAVPVIQNQEVLAMIVLANRSGGYREKLLKFVEPLVHTDRKSVV